MRFLLDTNLLSETVRPQPDAGVTAWLAEQAVGDLAVSVLSIGELQRGVVRRSPSPRRDLLQNWVDEDLPATYRGRTIPVDEPIAREWGRVSGEAASSGRVLPDVDGLLV